MKKHLTKSQKKKLILAVISVILCVALYIFGDSYLSTPEEGSITVHFIDVGQGDAALILTESGSVLIDAGTTDSGERVAAYVKARTKTLDYMILSHPHEDHIGGASAVFDSVDVKNVIMPDETADSGAFDRLLDSLESSDAEIIPAEKGDMYNLGDLSMEILSPDPDKTYENTNDVSIVLKVRFGRTSFLFTGDAESGVEGDILESGANIDCDVLKAGHHGSSTSSSERFIKAVSPEIAIISCGKDNPYGHPHKETTKLMEKYGVDFYRTDRCGDVVIISDGVGVSVE